MNNILDLSSSFDFNNNNVVKGEIEMDDVFELENNIEILVQDKIVEPTREIQTVTVDEDYDQLGTVTVNPIPDEYIIPDGTLDVDANGDVDVTMFRMARVGVYTPPVLQDKEIEIIENGMQMITADEGYDGLNSVEITTKVEGIGGGKIIPMSISFSNYKGTEQPGVNNLDISNITSLYRMFLSCSNLTELNLSNWNTNGVTNTSGLVYGCTNLKNLDLSNWDTSNVTDMKQMFYACKQLKELDLSSFDTSKVTDMSEMFSYCCSLTKLDIRNFNFSQVTSSTNIFGSQNYQNTWVPASCEIIVKDDTAKAWVLARSNSGFTNVKTVAEL